MELSRTEEGDFFANQCSYLREVVRRHGVEDLCSAQMMKESQEPEDELDRTPLHSTSTGGTTARRRSPMVGHKDQAGHRLCGQQDLLSYEPRTEVGDSNSLPAHQALERHPGTWLVV